MESRIMQVFYGNDCLPYKDSARSVHYPIVGNSFIGASGTTQIRFYVRDIGGVNNVSWVAISKLPNGQIGNQVLSTIALDSELNEYYVALDLGSYYTQLKGDVYISLNGYQGGIQVEQDAETGIYTINGTPIIEATGSIKLAINYAPQLPLGHHFQIDDLQQILGLMSEKANIINTVQVVADISQEDLSGYDDDQLFYDIQTKRYYKKTTESPYYVLVEDNSGILGSDRVLVRYESTQFTNLQDVYDIIGTKNAIIRINQPYNPFEFIVCFSVSSGSLVPTSVRAVYLSTLHTQYADLVNSDASNYASMETSIGSFATASEYNDRILHENNYKDYAVPYSGAKHNVDLNGRDIGTTKTVNSRKGIATLRVAALSNGTQGIFESTGKRITANAKEERARYHSHGVLYTPDTSSGIQRNLDFPNSSGTFATQEWTTSAIETLKANSFILVNTTTYPTIEDFLASQGEEGYIYLYPSTNQEQGYLEYIWENNEWLLIGTTQIDLTNYYTKAQADDKFVHYYGNNKNVDLEYYEIDAGSIRIYDGYYGEYLQIGPSDWDLSIYRDRMVKNVDGADNTFLIPATDDGGIFTFATQEYVQGYAVQMSETPYILYGVGDDTTQIEYPVDADNVGNGNVVRRNETTNTIVVGTPTSDTHATTKKYVDDSIASAISSVFKYKGTKTVAEINALSNIQVGDVYNVSDSGTLNAGNIQVRAGDNVAWTGSTWDKLAEDIDWSAYDEKFIAAGFFEVQNYNETSGEITFVFATELYDMSYDTNTGVMSIDAI